MRWLEMGDIRASSPDPAYRFAHAGYTSTQKLGLKTAFVVRPTEYGPLQKFDFEAKGDWDVVAKDFGELAAAMGC